MTKQKTQEPIYPLCWRILCNTGTSTLISQKRTLQIFKRLFRSWGLR